MPEKVKSLQDVLTDEFLNELQKKNKAGVLAVFTCHRDKSHPQTFWGKHIIGNGGDNLMKLVKNPKYNWKNRHWYLSINSFAVRRRKEQNTLGLNGLWIDADLNEHGIDVGDFIYPPHIDKLCKVAGIPEPNVLIASGHGAYLIWLFKHQVVVHNPVIKTMWSNLEKTMVNKFNQGCKKIYGAEPGDDSTKDSSRVLRIPTTFNVKRELELHKEYPETPKYPMCRLIWHTDKNEHDMFPWWIDNFTPKYHHHAHYADKKRRKRFPRPKRTEKGKRIRTALLTVKIPKNIMWQRTKDLIILLHSRKHDLTGYRDKFLFIYACCVVGIDGIKSTVKELDEINKSFQSSLPESEMNTLYGEVEHGNLEQYRFKSSTIIKWLQITPEEQHKMLNIMSHGEVIKRKQKRLRFRRLVHSHKVKARDARNAKIFKMHLRGYTKRYISAVIDVSPRTVSYVIAKFRKNTTANDAPKESSRNETKLMNDNNKSNHKDLMLTVIGNEMDIELNYLGKVRKRPS